MPHDLLAALLRGGLRTVHQPLVELGSRRVVAYEALCRGPQGSSLERPDLLFAAAAERGLTGRLDWAARVAALRSTLDGGLRAPATLFLNAEPEGLVTEAPEGFAALRQAVQDAGVQVVLEITERALTTRPAELLAAVEQARGWGWAIAVDDVGAERASLALLPFLAPDVIKLDLRLVQERTTVEVAQIVNAVRAQSERTGALLLAEGIETEQHAELALSMGAQYGQGWLFGRPGPLPAEPLEGPVLPLPGCRPPSGAGHLWESTRSGLAEHRAYKPLLVAMSKTLERQALADGEAAVVVGTFQHARHFTPASAARYTTLASSAAFVAALATDLPAEPAPGVRGTHLPADDPLTREWDLAVVGPHFAAALVARDLGDKGPEAERRFDYVLTYDRDTAVAVAAQLMRRVGQQPLVPAPRRPAAAVPRGITPPLGAELDLLLRRAVEATATGITIADARALDQPLVYVNAAFERLSGLPYDEVVGRNCRFLQDERTDRDAVRLLREQLRSGRRVSSLLVNRRPDGTHWWNELGISPVHGPDGSVTHFIGVQSDVTARVEAERRLAHLATHDALTGLTNRNGFYSSLDELLVRAARHDRACGLLYVDLDGFKQVNDLHGHGAGDELLVAVAAALRGVARQGDVVARLGGDEFALVLPDLEVPDGVSAHVVLSRAAARVRDAVAALPAHGLPLRASTGTAVFPYDAGGPEALLLQADRAMYADKRGPLLPRG